MRAALVAEVEEPFPNGCRYPGDPQGPAAEVWNCRCTLVPDLEGYDALSDGRHDKNLKGISYEDWKAGKNPPKPKEGSGRSFAKFGAMPSVLNQLDKFGITADQYREATREVMRGYGLGDLRQFATLTKADQREVGKDALDAAIAKQVDLPLSVHAIGQMKAREVTPAQINDALNSPIHIGEIRTDADGRRGQKYIGMYATAVINPDEKRIITTYPTKSSNRRKYGTGNDEKP